MFNLAKLNREVLARVKTEGMSHGMSLLVEAIQASQYQDGGSDRLVIYMYRITPKRLRAYVIIDGKLQRLCIPEAGHKLYAGYKDGYQFNNTGSNLEIALLERLHSEASRHIWIDLKPQSNFTYEAI